MSQIIRTTKNFSEEQKIGEGTTSVIYEAFIDGKIRAVKKMLPEFNTDQTKSIFKQELKVLQVIEHPNIVKLQSYDEENICLVYEKATFTLSKKLFGHESRNPLSWQQRLKVIKDMHMALSYLHDNKIIHRDVKSSNMFIFDSKEGEICKLGDFGISKRDLMSQKSTTIKGTVGYMAPEQYKNGQLTLKSDIQGYGVFLMELLSGQPAKDDARKDSEHLIDQLENLLEQKDDIRAVCDAKVKFPPAVAQLIWELAVSCTEDKPRKRPLCGDIKSQIDMLENIALT